MRGIEGKDNCPRLFSSLGARFLLPWMFARHISSHRKDTAERGGMHFCGVVDGFLGIKNTR